MKLNEIDFNLLSDKELINLSLKYKILTVEEIKKTTRKQMIFAFQMHRFQLLFRIAIGRSGALGFVCKTNTFSKIFHSTGRPEKFERHRQGRVKGGSRKIGGAVAGDIVKKHFTVKTRAMTNDRAMTMTMSNDQAMTMTTI